MSEENWWPSKEEYDPKITKEKWLELLKDENIFNFNSMCMMKRFLDIGGEATCIELADKYGKTYSAYISFSIWLATRIQKRTSCEMPPERDENARLWPILYVGRRVEKNDSHSGTYVWRLREELKAALEVIDLLHDERYLLYDFEGEFNMNYWLINPKSEGSRTDLSDESIDNIIMGWDKKECPKFYNEVISGDIIIVTEKAHSNTSLHYIGIADFLDEKNHCWKLKYSTKEKNDEIQKIIRENPSDFGGGESSNPWGPTKSIIKLSDNPAESKIKEILNQFFKEAKMKEQIEQYKDLLLNTHNLILHGAPGTGKTYLAHEIAKAMGCFDNEIGFVQFHPSYDYTDFVEGLRPVNDGSSGQIGFERKDGVFKKFCEKALKNLKDSEKTTEQISKEISIDEETEDFLSSAIDENIEFTIVTGNKFFVTDFNEKNIYISIPENEKVKELVLQRLELSSLLNAEVNIENGTAVREFFKRKWRTQQDSYVFALYKEINQKLSPAEQISNVQRIEKKNFIFIIDEINRGEMSKIFGELFFSIDPGYRGKDGLIKTQYQNLITESNVFYNGFYVPENVYIIGTMNDIDRNVESMDFAFRRRFTFKEITAKDTQEQILSGLDDSIREEATNRIDSLNDAISKIEGLSSSYHIGGAYFLKLKDFKGTSDERFAQLWDYHLEGLLREYLRGMENAESKLEDLEKAYENDNLMKEK